MREGEVRTHAPGKSGVPRPLHGAARRPPDRAERRHEAVSRAFVPLDVTLREREPVPGRIAGRRLGALRIVQVVVAVPGR